MRLATYDTMQTDVWQKLPNSFEDAEGNIIEAAYFGVQFWAFRPKRRPPPGAKWKRWKDYAASLEEGPIITPHSARDAAQLLLTEIGLLKDDARQVWGTMWPGPQSTSYEQACDLVEHLHTFFSSMALEYETLIGALPKATTPEQFFSRYVSQRLVEIFGEPHDAIVAALTEVAFDRPGETSAETVRGRRRTAYRKK